MEDNSTNPISRLLTRPIGYHTAVATAMIGVGVICVVSHFYDRSSSIPERRVMMNQTANPGGLDKILGTEAAPKTAPTNYSHNGIPYLTKGKSNTTAEAGK